MCAYKCTSRMNADNHSLCTGNWCDEARARKGQFEVQFLTRSAFFFLYMHRERKTASEGQDTAVISGTEKVVY